MYFSVYSIFFASSSKCKLSEAGIMFGITIMMKACFRYGMLDAALNCN